MLGPKNNLSHQSESVPESPPEVSAGQLETEVFGKGRSSVLHGESAILFRGMSEGGKSIFSRLYDGLYKIPIVNVVIGKMEIAHNNLWFKKNEEKAAKLKDQLAFIDFSMAELDKSKGELESAISNLQGEGIFSIYSLRSKMQAIDDQKRKLLYKKDRIQSRFEDRENKAKLHVAKRDIVADRLIGYYDKKIMPMESEISKMKKQVGRLDLATSEAKVKIEGLSKRASDLEKNKDEIETLLSKNGASSQKIKRDETIKVLSSQIKHVHKEIAKAKEKLINFAQKKGKINDRIVEADRKSNPYRDKKTWFVRIKEERLQEMNVKTRDRKVIFQDSEDIRAHAREGVSEARSGKQYRVFLDAVKAVIMDQSERAAANQDATEDEKKYALSRTAALHTLYKINNFEDLYAENSDEGDRKFLELTIRLWDELAVHEKSDLDAKSCLKLMELAGIKIDNHKEVPKGKKAERGLTMDSAEKHGVIAEGDKDDGSVIVDRAGEDSDEKFADPDEYYENLVLKGKRLIFDHHGKESDRSTSATKFVYETLVEMGLLSKEQQVDLAKYVEFVTRYDNLDFGSDEASVYENYHKNLYGLADKMSIEDVLRFIRSGFDPKANLPPSYLKKTIYTYNGKTEALAEFSKKLKSWMRNGEKTVDRMVKDGFMIDTGDDRFGKVLIDTMRKGRKGNKWENKVEGSGPSRQMTAFAKGFGAYVVWSPEDNKFLVFTKNKMDEKLISGGFSQGKNMRGHMLISGDGNTQPVKPEFLEEILAKLSDKPDFKIEGRLSELMGKDVATKRIINLIKEGNLTDDIIRDIMSENKVRAKNLISEVAYQLQGDEKMIKTVFKAKEDAIPSADKKNPKHLVDAAIETLLEYQKNNASKIQASAGVPSQTP